jgi:hypothetical protein
MYEFLVRNKWVVLAAVIIAFAGLQLLVSRDDSGELPAGNATSPSTEIQAAPPAATHEADPAPDPAADEDEDFSGDDESADDTSGDDPAPDMNEEQSTRRSTNPAYSDIPDGGDGPQGDRDE